MNKSEGRIRERMEKERMEERVNQEKISFVMKMVIECFGSVVKNPFE